MYNNTNLCTLFAVLDGKEKISMGFRLRFRTLIIFKSNLYYDDEMNVLCFIKRTFQNCF
jgi:hypothetical protein